MKNIIILVLLLSATHVSAQQSNENSKQLYHQFDFWIGHWDVYQFGTDSIVAESRVESIIDGIGLLENYSTEKGSYSGKSLNKYNSMKKRWEQYWIDNAGLTLFLSGGIIDDKMVLSDINHGDPADRFNKITWEKINQDALRQTWSISKDSGVTWSIVFDGEYKRRKQ